VADADPGGERRLTDHSSTVHSKNCIYLHSCSYLQ
jgi:hypothetical protein